MTIKSVIQCIFDDDMDGGGDDDNDTGNGPEWVPLTGRERERCRIRLFPQIHLSSV